MPTLKIAFIDHYDSFSWNLIEWFKADPAGPIIQVVDCEDQKTMNYLFLERTPLILSPGPKSPEQATPTMSLLLQSLGRVPVFGVCLGHQMLGLALGGEVTQAIHPLHGRCRSIRVTANQWSLGFPATFSAAAYNSLGVKASSIESRYHLAHCSQGELQAIGFALETVAPALGVQFHPESFLSDDLTPVRRWWLSRVAEFMRQLDLGAGQDQLSF